MKNVARVFGLMIFLLLPALASAQTSGQASAQTAPPLDAAQLDQITTPIALYPDPVVAQLLVAATYPDQVDLAAGWLDDPLNAGLQGDALAAALQTQSWDSSVKSLVTTPRLLFLLSDNDDWMRQLGEAFVAQQSAVMDSVQRIRWQAYRAGNLRSTGEQTVAVQNNYILIEPVALVEAPPVPTIWVLPVWDWQHHRMNGYDNMHHYDNTHAPDFDTRFNQGNLQPQPPAPSREMPQQPAHHEEQGRPIDLSPTLAVPQNEPHIQVGPIHAESGHIEAERPQEQENKAQENNSDAPLPPGGNQTGNHQ